MPDVTALKAKLEALKSGLSIPPFGLTLRRARDGKSLDGWVTQAYVNRQGPYTWFGTWNGDEGDNLAYSEAMIDFHAAFPNLVRELGNVGYLELITRFAPAERDFSTAGEIFTLPLEPVSLALKALLALQRAEAAAKCYGLLKSEGLIAVDGDFIPDSPKADYGWYIPRGPDHLDPLAAGYDEHIAAYKAELEAIG